MKLNEAKVNKLAYELALAFWEGRFREHPFQVGNGLVQTVMIEAAAKQEAFDGRWWKQRAETILASL